MDTRPETEQLVSILEFLDKRIQAKTAIIAEDESYLPTCKTNASIAQIQYSIEYGTRARDTVNDIRTLVQDRLETINATPKKSLLVAGDIPAGCACPFAEKIPCTMVQEKCPTKENVKSFKFSCALARGFDLAEQEK